MKTQSDIDKLKEILESLEGIKRAAPQPYFYTRLTGRLQRNKKTLWETIGFYIGRPAVAMICLSFVLIFNAFILFRQDGDKVSSLSAPKAEQTDNEYVFDNGNNFDYENLDQ